ncbi:transmembrane protein 44 isoform X18 [Macaca fascicularis]|uniref:transmembrane protein 44 isoform X18 n=1 Tax=Macaca fascicularis TaxID=9541 RepID=UPI003D15A8B7
MAVACCWWGVCEGKAGPHPLCRHQRDLRLPLPAASGVAGAASGSWCPLAHGSIVFISASAFAWPSSLGIIFLSCVMKSKMRQALGFATEARESPDTQALLTCAEKEEENQEARNEDKNLDWVPLTTLSHCKSLRTMTAISRYMELTIEPVQQSENSPTRRALPPGSRRLPPGPTSNTGVTFQRDKPHPNHSREAGCSATRLPGDGQTSAADALLQEPPSYPPVQVIRARVSSSSSSEVSSINSDLEWDPEDVNLEGSKDKVELLGSQVHRDSVRTAHLNDDD